MNPQIVFDFGNDEGSWDDDGDVREMDIDYAQHIDEQMYQTPKTHQTRDIMTKYELTSIIGARGTLLARGAPPYVNPHGETDPNKIAKMEVLSKKLPVVIRRFLPNGECEDWHLEDLNVEKFKE